MKVIKSAYMPENKCFYMYCTYCRAQFEVSPIEVKLFARSLARSGNTFCSINAPCDYCRSTMRSDIFVDSNAAELLPFIPKQNRFYYGNEHSIVTLEDYLKEASKVDDFARKRLLFLMTALRSLDDGSFL